jgi:pimeloyl-ACP methyl ester carboxylesterase
VRSPERDTDLDSRLVDVDGLRIRTAVRGQGPPVLLIMGIGGNLEMWGRDAHERVVPALLEHLRNSPSRSNAGSADGEP